MNSPHVERLLALPRVALGKWPTPIESLTHASIGKVLLKRDDLSGFGGERRSGVKARKLETFLAYLRGKHVDLLTMPLGNITNLGDDLARIAVETGIELRLLIADDPPLPAKQRIEIFRGLEGQARLLNHRSIGMVICLLATLGRARLSGRNAYAVLPSPGHPSAVAGMACGYIELARQICEGDGEFPRAIYIASASGVSAAGLALGEALMRMQGFPPVKIVAVQVAPYPLKAILPGLLWWTRLFLKLPEQLDFSTLLVAGDPCNTIYGRFDARHEGLCERLQSEHGVLVDPIYGAKSWSVMEKRECGTDQSSRPPLFWHCGYTPHWRAYRTQVDTGFTALDGGGATPASPSRDVSPGRTWL